MVLLRTTILVNAKKGTLSKGAKSISYLRTENFKNHTLFRGTYLYNLYMVVPPSGGDLSPHFQHALVV